MTCLIVSDYSGIFTKPPIKKCINNILSYIDDIDSDLFSVHEFDDIVWELGYQIEQTIYYHSASMITP